MIIKIKPVKKRKTVFLNYRYKKLSNTKKKMIKSQNYF